MNVDLIVNNFILSLLLQPTLLKEVLLCNRWEWNLYLVEAIFVDVCDIWNKSIFDPLLKGTMKSNENLLGEVEQSNCTCLMSLGLHVLGFQTIMS
jgi:hypothetical protein